ncbi:GYD domain-containing protein [Ruegeria sp. SCP11]|uniref:GYD domain-containing protein n=1 Tax=Ruegeria sp. SCP11 TaxID=3141378 RepID=UPI00333C96CB
MALFMLMARFTPQALAAVVEGELNREEMARKAVESAGGKLVGFYGLLGQDYHIAFICDFPKMSDFLAIEMSANVLGSNEKLKSIPLYGWSEYKDALETYKAVKEVYTPPSHS